MQVNLEPVGPTGRGSRLGRRLAAVAPVVLLVAVVGIAVTAGRFGSGGSSQATAPVSGTAPIGGLENGVTTVARSAAPSLQPTVSLPAWTWAVPVSAWNRPVRSLPTLLADRAAGTVKSGLVAVAGLVAHDSRAARCADPNPMLPTDFCDRSALLAPTPDPLEGGTYVFGERGPGPGRSPDGIASFRLELRIPAGIAMPLMPAADGPPGAPRQDVSIVIGRFTSPVAPDCNHPSPCRDDFVVERLAWSAGHWIDRALVRDPDIPESANPLVGPRMQAIATREADRVEQILSLAILQPARLAAFDQLIAEAAAAGARSLGVATRPVWYIRSAGHPAANEGGDLTWAVMDHQTGLLLASG
jgi:hypothetical protein